MKIAFVAVPGGKPWNGATIYNEPLGGSEAAVAYMARAWARRGHHVTVYSHGQPGIFDNVLYAHVQGIGSIRADTDVIVVSRWIEALNDYIPESSALRVLWCHDMPQGGRLSVKANAIMFISEFQARAWGVTGNNVFGSTDGVDTDVFRPAAGGDGRDERKLVWLSNPDRGLALAARIFQTLRQRWPDLELHVYGRAGVYGWSDDAERPYLPLEEHRENVFLHDPLPRARLAVELQRAWAMFYPTWWPETCCMSALESQACGTPVICSPAGALPETVKGGIVGHDFLNAVSQLRNPNKWSKESLRGVEHASLLTWENIAEGWEEVFTDLRRQL